METPIKLPNIAVPNALLPDATVLVFSPKEKITPGLTRSWRARPEFLFLFPKKKIMLLRQKVRCRLQPLRHLIHHFHPHTPTIKNGTNYFVPDYHVNGQRKLT